MTIPNNSEECGNDEAVRKAKFKEESGEDVGVWDVGPAGEYRGGV